MENSFRSTKKYSGPIFVCQWYVAIISIHKSRRCVIDRKNEKGWAVYNYEFLRCTYMIKREAKKATRKNELFAVIGDPKLLVRSGPEANKSKLLSL